MPLKDDLEQTLAKTERLARQNYTAAFTLAAISAIGSLAAAIFAAAGSADRALIAVLAALPAAVLAANAVMKFDSRAAFHWRKAKRLAALNRALLYQNAPESDIAEKWSTLDIQMEGDWQPFGGLTPPTKDNR